MTVAAFWLDRDGHNSATALDEGTVLEACAGAPANLFIADSRGSVADANYNRVRVLVGNFAPTHLGFGAQTVTSAAQALALLASDGGSPPSAMVRGCGPTERGGPRRQAGVLRSVK